MQLNAQKRLAAQLLKCGKNRIVFDSDRLEDIKEAITRADMNSLINDKAVMKRPERGVSQARVRKIKLQKRHGNRQGVGSRKGKKTARLPSKDKWIDSIRIQRSFLKELRNKEIIAKSDYQMLYLKSKGGFFRSKRHIKLYIEEHELAEKK
jgi:large subunit ribosomal protein L19e